tara:strand:- start:410 stop:523 length:114 start_codon:yes stop_codon:yes gene_type:complete
VQVAAVVVLVVAAVSLVVLEAVVLMNQIHLELEILHQ